MAGHIAILGIFVADVTFRTDRLPQMGETVIGKSVALSPGGKGSNSRSPRPGLAPKSGSSPWLAVTPLRTWRMQLGLTRAWSPWWLGPSAWRPGPPR